MADSGQNVLEILLDRLLAGLLNGPGLNCRPHASRQRIDLTALAKLRDIEPTAILEALLSDEGKATIVGRVTAPPPKGDGESEAEQSAARPSCDGPADAPVDGAGGAQLADGDGFGSEITEDIAVGERASAEVAPSEVARAQAALGGDAPAQAAPGGDAPAQAAPADTRPAEIEVEGGAAMVPGEKSGETAIEPERAGAAATAHDIEPTAGNLVEAPAEKAIEIRGDPRGNSGIADAGLGDNEGGDHGYSQGGTPTEAPSKAAPDRGHALPVRDDPQRAWIEQQSIFTKARNIVEDARTYEQDTGVHVLSIGFPLLSIPAGGAGGGSKRRILAPIAFIPVDVTVVRGAKPSVSITCRGEGADRIVPNDALLAWLEQQQKAEQEEFFADIEGEQPWREIACLVKHVARAVGVAAPALFAPADGENWAPAREGFALKPAPRAEDENAPAILNSAVLGLYPMANQALIRDTKALVAGEALAEPAQSFVKVGLGLGGCVAEPAAAAETKRDFHEERLISVADPCQARAVRLARTCRGLVIHGPPGTGKSQTITNVIGDHLARGERVLMVCDKRTALDVVYHRLEHLGLESLCAVVHDPQRDQRNFYKSVRTQIDELADQRAHPAAGKKLQKLDTELVELHGELTRHRAALMDRPDDHTPSVHELIGDWLDLPEPALQPKADLATISPAQFESQTAAMGELLRRALSVDFAVNPWASRTGVTLAEFLQRSMADVRSATAAAAASAIAADATLDESIPPFLREIPAAAQGEARLHMASLLEKAMAGASTDLRQAWSQRDARSIATGRQQIADAEPMLQRLRQKRLDTDLAIAARAAGPTIAAVARQISTLDAYLRFARKWHAFIHFKQKALASDVMTQYGLTLGADDAERLRAFLQQLRERLILTQIYSDVSRQPAPAGPIADEALEEGLTSHGVIVKALSNVYIDPAMAGLRDGVLQAMTDSAHAAKLIGGLKKSAARAEAIAAAIGAWHSTGVVSAKGIADFNDALLANRAIARESSAMAESIETLEGVIRVAHALEALPAPLTGAARAMIDGRIDPHIALAVVKKSVLAGEIARRLQAAPDLQAIDAHHIQEAFDRFSELSLAKRALIRDAILHRWVGRQKERLLAATGSRLNSIGADVKRRFMLHGTKAMRLRKVIELGGKTEEGDPLFDLRPIWMASPETVAQIFPRAMLFDVVIFDEASQCRLEEALPVLTRARRVVVAGDQKQLPPTRFFESAAVASNDREIESDQELFELQQSETEDLLSASLNMEIQESYLDVHYRSRNADLIEFSNQNFYGSRLQAIPGHPKHRARFAPLTIDHADGVYEKSANPAEADRVCQIVRDLLKRASPPSIGIACFNVVQRDLILEKLDDLVEEDNEFARRFAEARTRVGRGSFEGLIVKNLENVQGDERDHIIISTTYGPDARGKFYRRFGPLASAGGGRRLNVLVTRAREEVHLVTSIPPGVYRSLPPVPPGGVPTGAWLLFSYLQFAESLGAAYERGHEILERSAGMPAARCDVNEPASASPFAAALGRRLADVHGVANQVNWGNAGFCIDIALRHPTRPADVTLGVLCDASRFAGAEDPVEWDLFRTEVHKSQGWALHRIWSPHYFRDPAGAEERLSHAVEEFLSSEIPPDELPVTPAAEV